MEGCEVERCEEDGGEARACDKQLAISSVSYGSCGLHGSYGSYGSHASAGKSCDAVVEFGETVAYAIGQTSLRCSLEGTKPGPTSGLALSPLPTNKDCCKAIGGAAAWSNDQMRSNDASSQSCFVK